MVRFDSTVFQRTLKQYTEVNRKRTLPQIMNTKAWFVARASTWFTRKADRGKIESTLGKLTTIKYKTKSGKVQSRRKLALANNAAGAPVAALIINARRGLAGKMGLFGKAMAAAVRKMIAGRIRSIAFIKSGWLPAIKRLAPLADRGGAPQMDTAAKQRGQAKGSATPAYQGWRIFARITNAAFGNRGKASAKNRALRVADDGLDKAFQNELASMQSYMERKMKPDADRFNRAQK